MYRLFLSLRFLRHHWLMTLIGSFFVGASLVILVVVMAVMDGFQAKLRDTMSGSSADLMLTPAWEADPVALSKAVEELLPEVVVAAGPYYETITLARKAGRPDPTKEKMHAAAVYGIDPRREARINKFREYLSRLDRDTGKRRPPSVRDPDDPFKLEDAMDEAAGEIGVVIGVGLAEELGVTRRLERLRIVIAKPGEKDPGAKDEPERDPLQDISLEYRQVIVVGFYESGNGEVDKSCVFMDHRAFRDVFRGDHARASVRCRLADSDAIPAAEAAIKRVLDKLVVRSVPRGVVVEPWQQTLWRQSWQDKHRTLVQAIESEKSMILVIAFLIVVAGTSSIFAAQWLLVSDKVREIGILRALGADFSGVVSIFVLNGFLMGLLGSAGGAVGGLLVVRYIDQVHVLVSWVMGRPVFDSRVYLFDKIPTLVDLSQVTNYALAALVCTLVAAAVPAIRAGLLRPAEALHRD